MTKLQRHVLGVVTAHHRRGQWYRASRSGERVTLASLFRSGVLTRRAWRGKAGEADAAYEYQLAPRAAQIAQQTLGSGDGT